MTHQALNAVDGKRPSGAIRMRSIIVGFSLLFSTTLWAATNNGYHVPAGSQLVHQNMADPTIVETNYGGRKTFFLSGTTFWDRLHVRYSHDGRNFRTFGNLSFRKWGDSYCGIWAPHFEKWTDDWVRITFSAERQKGRSTCISRTPAQHNDRIGMYESWFSVRNGSVSPPTALNWAGHLSNGSGPQTREYPFRATSYTTARNTLRIDPFVYYDPKLRRHYWYYVGFFGNVGGSNRYNSIVRWSPETKELLELTANQPGYADKIVESPAITQYTDTRGARRYLFAFSAGAPLWTGYGMYFSQRTPTSNSTATRPASGASDWRDLLPPIYTNSGGYCTTVEDNKPYIFSGGGGQFIEINGELWMYYHINHNLRASNGDCVTHARHVYRTKVRIDWYTNKPVNIHDTWTRFEWVDNNAPYFWNRQYSLDIKDATKTVAPCVWGSLLQTDKATEFTGTCANGQKLNWNRSPRARVCTTDNGNWGQARCTPWTTVRPNRTTRMFFR